jgi:hypothetical protein
MKDRISKRTQQKKEKRDTDEAKSKLYGDNSATQSLTLEEGRKRKKRLTCNKDKKSATKPRGRKGEREARKEEGVSRRAR